MATARTGNGHARPAPRVRIVQDSAKGKAMSSDSMQNLLSGLGGGRDKTAFTKFAITEIPAQQLEAAYRNDWISRKIIDIPAYDSTREWRQWQADRTDITKLEEAEKEFRIKRRLMSALIKSRLYGGGALILGVDQGKPEDPLILETLKKDCLKFVHAVSRYDISAGPLNLDVQSPDYGTPQYYDSSGPDIVRMHPSRVIRLIGLEPPRVTLTAGWGDPILQVVVDAITQTGSTVQGIAALVQESQLDVISIPGLTDSITSATYEARLKKRFGLAAEAKSIFNMLLLDKEEQWQRIVANFSTLDSIAKLFLEIVAGAADIPATRMLGQSPRGLNATGLSDIRNYYDMISSAQSSDLSPAIEPLDEIIIRSVLGTRPEEIYYDWNPLWQMDEAQTADIALKKAQAFQIDVTTGLVDQGALKVGRENQLVDDGTYPGFETALEEAAALAEQQPPVDPAQGTPPAPNEGGPGNEPALAPGQKQQLPNPTNQPTPPPAKDAVDAMVDRARLHDATPRTLYVYRPVLNAADIRAWFKAQGMMTLVPENEMHATICYSRTPVDWSKIQDAFVMGPEDKTGNLTVPPGGMRMVDKFNDCAVLLFSSSSLNYRHCQIERDTGATWDYPDYQPHITLTTDASGIDVNTLKPYVGPIVFGPEVFEQVQPGAMANVVEDAMWEQPR